MFPPLYAILDTAQICGPAPSVAKILIGAGVSLIQIRDKRASAKSLFEVSRELVALGCGGVRVIINDRPDIAAMSGASGVHVGQEDLPVEAARKICGPALWVGISTHNLEQFEQAARTSADYIAVGPIFPTATKENPDPVVGIELLRKVRRLTQKPLVAIGGITLESAESVYRAGADSLAVVRDLLSAGDPAERTRQYLAVAELVFSHRTGAN